MRVSAAAWVIVSVAIMCHPAIARQAEPVSARSAADADAAARNSESTGRAPHEAALPLCVGDKAPELRIAKWVKGEAVKAFEPGKVYLVEFWATWCPPCRRSIPLLTDLQAKFQDKGLVVIGVSSQETSGLSDVEPFVRKQAERMAYSVAWDDENRTARGYLEASGIDGIPTAFLINQDGRIAWIGTGLPMPGLESAVQQVLDKTYDLESAAAKSRRQAAIDAKAKPLIQAAREAYDAADFPRVIDSLDKAIALDPGAMTAYMFHKFRLLAVDMKEPEKAYAYLSAQLPGPLKDDAASLSGIAGLILDDANLAERNYKLALQAGERANALTKGGDPLILDTVARASYETGAVEQAIAMERKALELSDDAKLKSEFQSRLDRYSSKPKKE